MPVNRTDRELLTVILAAQIGLISYEQARKGIQSWLITFKKPSILTILEIQGSIKNPDFEALDTEESDFEQLNSEGEEEAQRISPVQLRNFVRLCIAANGNDSASALRSLRITKELWKVISAFDDPELEHSARHVRPRYSWIRRTLGWILLCSEWRWSQIDDELRRRNAVMVDVQKRLESNQHVPKDRILEISATDVFVEKAQILLTRRAKLLLFVGCSMAALTLIVLYVGGKSVYEALEKFAKSPPALDGYRTTIVLFKGASLAGILAGAVYFLASLTRALLHEGIANYYRRHALRFGRLYVYLKKGQINFEELSKAFHWNEEITTAFRDMKPESMTQSFSTKALETVSEVAKTSAETLKTVAGAAQKPGG